MGRIPVVVGVGTSAGGLEALEALLQPVSGDCPLSFVVVQHLDPARKGLLVELLGRATSLPVEEIQDGTRAKPGHVHVIPPNRHLSIENGVFHLEEPAEAHGGRLTVDHFLRSLAEDKGAAAIGIILSGMGSDGVLGLRAIKEEAGTCVVQDPATAKFDGMPRSAIDAGLADIVAAPGDMVSEILAYLQSVHRGEVGDGSAVVAHDRRQLDKVLMLLRARTGHDFGQYKKSTLHRRIQRRLSLHKLKGIHEYVRFLRGNPGELDLLFKELLIGVTSFFRDAAVWARLKNKVLPALQASRPRGSVLRGWSAGCSTGEEAYSLAMVFREVAGDRRTTSAQTLQLFATDIDREAIETARSGVYPSNISADVSEARLRRFFTQEDRSYRVSKEVRSTVVFAQQNLVLDPPFTKLDIILCRNLLIYLEPELQRMVIGLFHYALKPGGILVLGGAETVGAADGMFAAVAGNCRIYRRLESGLRDGTGGLPPIATSHRPPPVAMEMVQGQAPFAGAHFQAGVEQLLIHRLAPPAILSNAKGDILYVGGKTGRYLEPAVGKATLNLFAMAREGLGSALATAFAKASRTKAAVALDGVHFGPDGHEHRVDLVVEILGEPDALRGMVLTVFREPGPGSIGRIKHWPARAKSSGAAALSRELERCRQELNSLREEMQISQEELRSTNEELQSTNEELQSANEELTTSKEEMQSMNEELQTVNHELQAKLDELSRTSDDMKNLLNSTGIATLFLDDQLRVRRYTTQTSNLINLIPGDAGRSITDIVSNLDYPGFASDIHNVLQSLMQVERQVPSRDGRWFNVRVMPYRTLDNRIDGVVITFLDVTAPRRGQERLREIFNLLQLSPDGRRDVVVQGEPPQKILEKVAQALLRGVSEDAKPIPGAETKSPAKRGSRR